MESIVITILIILVIVITCIIAIAIAALLRDDIRIALFENFLNPLLIMGGKDSIIRNTNQKEVYNLIRQLPGISYRGLLHDLDMDNASLVHNISLLHRENLISQKNQNGTISFYPRYISSIQTSTQPLPPMTPLEKVILDNLRRLGPAARCEIETTLQVSQPTVRQSLTVLKRRGLVDFDGLGKWSYCWAVNNPPKIK